jgi:outer membrane protein assembly factor BamB
MKNAFRVPLVAAALLLTVFRTPSVPAADWPMWRGDTGRTGSVAEALPGKLHLQWTRDFPPLKPAFCGVRQERLQFDRGYEPVVMGRTLFVSSSRNDSVSALDTETGAQQWRFYADGPVRLAPVATRGRVYFGSDDGFLYCLDAASGKLVWKARGAPSNRKILGNGRLISVWPVRGGPVVADDRVYFAAGVWPFEGVFVQALDARTGKTVWVNDRSGG